MLMSPSNGEWFTRGAEVERVKASFGRGLFMKGEEEKKSLLPILIVEAGACCWPVHSRGQPHHVLLNCLEKETFFFTALSE
jgi:hypothetical protein